MEIADLAEAIHGLEPSEAEALVEGLRILGYRLRYVHQLNKVQYSYTIHCEVEWKPLLIVSSEGQILNPIETFFYADKIIG